MNRMLTKLTTIEFGNKILVLLSIISLFLTGSAIATLSNQAYAIKQFKIRVVINEDPIKRGHTQQIKVIVKDQSSNSALSNALVKLTVSSPAKDSDSTSSHTNSNGVSTFDVKIDPHAKIGTYDVQVKVSKNGYRTADINTSFEVIKSSNDSSGESTSSSSSSSSSNLHVIPASSSSSSASATIDQSNSQKSVCISGSDTISSCNETAINTNNGNAVSANVGDSGSGGSSHGHQSAKSEISQENNQRAVCISGGSTTGSCDQAAANTNNGNAVSANVGDSGSGGSSHGHQSAKSDTKTKGH